MTRALAHAFHWHTRACQWLAPCPDIWDQAVQDANLRTVHGGPFAGWWKPRR